MIEFRDEHISLRALDREHCHKLWEATEADQALPTEHFQPGLARGGADKWFDEIQAKQGQTGIDFGVFDLDGNVLGHFQIHSIDWQDRSGEMGFGFAKVSDRGKGYGTSALQLIVWYGFDHLGLHRLSANTVAFNKPAIRVLEKCGFQFEGRQRDSFFFGGRWYDRVSYSILETEFRKSPNARSESTKD